VARTVIFGIALVAALIAAIPIIAFPIRPGSRLDPYENRDARWLVYAGSLIALTLFIVLARSE
jgi:hypothetical protein